MVWHGDISKKKRTGGKPHPYRKKRAFERGRLPTETRLGELLLKIERVRGGGKKFRAISCNFANVTDPKAGKTMKVPILRVVKNPSNVEYDKRKILTKGAIIDTPIGLARVTSRPGQDGVVNAVVISKE